MRRIFVRFASALAIVGLVASPAFAGKSPTEINAEIDANFADNKQGLITEAVLRATLKDIAAAQTSLYYLVSTCAANQWVNGFSVTGAPTCTRPSFSNLSGSISAGQMIAPGVGTLGGVYSSSAGSNQFATGIDTTGAVAYAQPSFSNLSGTIGAAQLIAPGASTFGAVKSSSAPANQFANGINTSGVVTYAQPAFSNLSGSIAASQLIAPGASTFGAVKSSSAPTNQFANGIDTTGAVTYARPDAADVTYSPSGTGAVATTVRTRILRDPVSPLDYGAACNGSTDDATAFSNAFAAFDTVQMPLGAICFVSALTVPAGKTLRGATPRPDFLTASTSASLNTLPGLSLGSGSITLNQGATVENLFVKKSGLTFPLADASTFSGTAIIFAGDNPTVRNVLVVGFAQLLGETATSVSRFTIEGFYGDGQAGLYFIKPSYDSSRIKNVHLWPFATQPNATCAALQRTGSGIYLNAAQDDTYIDDVLTYGFKYGINLATTGGAGFGKVWTDYPSSCASGSGSIGLYAQANVTSISISQAWIWGSEFGVIAAMNATEKIKFGIAQIDTIASSAVTLLGGDVDFNELQCRNIVSHCIVATSATSHIRARGMASAVGGAIVLPNGNADPNFLDVRLMSDAAAGTPSFNGGTVAPTSVASAATLALPINGDAFTVTGTTNIATITGGWGGRQITLRFSAALTLDQSGNIILANGKYLSAAGSYLTLIYDSGTSKWVEVARSPSIYPNGPSTKTANYTVDSGTGLDTDLIFNGGGSLTVTLPAPSAANAGRVLRIKTIAAQTVVSASSNVVPLAGGAAGTAILAATAGKWADLKSDGTNWIIMASN